MFVAQPAGAEQGADMAGKSNIVIMHRNFSIFLQEIDGKWYEFGYYEYTGENFEEDMARFELLSRVVDRIL